MPRRNHKNKRYNYELWLNAIEDYLSGKLNVMSWSNFLTEFVPIVISPVGAMRSTSIGKTTVLVSSQMQASIR